MVVIKVGAGRLQSVTDRSGLRVPDLNAFSEVPLLCEGQIRQLQRVDASPRRRALAGHYQSSAGAASANSPATWRAARSSAPCLPFTARTPRWLPLLASRRRSSRVAAVVRWAKFSSGSPRTRSSMSRGARPAMIPSAVSSGCWGAGLSLAGFGRRAFLAGAGGISGKGNSSLWRSSRTSRRVMDDPHPDHPRGSRSPHRTR